MTNLVFIDGQNLHLGIQSNNWAIDHQKFRIYLKDKFKITEAYYYLGYVDEEHQKLYKSLQQAGFIVTFKEHSKVMQGRKKGNVDTDIVFEVMESLIEREDFEKIYLVSGDGDYIKMVKFLIKKNKFGKILFPNQKKASSLYKSLTSNNYLDMSGIRAKIEYKKKGDRKH